MTSHASQGSVLKNRRLRFKRTARVRLTLLALSQLAVLRHHLCAPFCREAAQMSKSTVKCKMAATVNFQTPLRVWDWRQLSQGRPLIYVPLVYSCAARRCASSSTKFCPTRDARDRLAANIMPCAAAGHHRLPRRCLSVCPRTTSVDFCGSIYAICHRTPRSDVKLSKGSPHPSLRVWGWSTLEGATDRAEELPLPSHVKGK